jgi:hypothetical protein
VLLTITRALYRGVAALELRGHPHVHHRPTRAQVRVYADLNGFGPHTYRLEPTANWMPADLDLEHLDGLAFTFHDEHGWRHETTVLADGCRFEVLMPSTRDRELLDAWAAG